MNDRSEPIRLAMRVEGNWWVAYMATTVNMERAVELGRMHLRALQAVPGGTDRWKALMVDVLGANLAAIGATPLSWDERKAPESERSGRA